MKIRSDRLGEITVEARDVLVAPEGLPGFPGPRRFHLARIAEDDPVIWLQDAEDSGLALPVIEPGSIISEYAPELPEAELDALGGPDADDLRFLLVLVIPSDPAGVTVNLRAPIAVNERRGIARQVILDDEAYPVRYRLFPHPEDASTTGGKTDAHPV